MKNKYIYIVGLFYLICGIVLGYQILTSTSIVDLGLEFIKYLLIFVVVISLGVVGAAIGHMIDLIAQNEQSTQTIKEEKV